MSFSGLQASLANFWNSISPTWRKWIEATAWGMASAAGTIIFEAWQHDGGIQQHTLVLAGGAAVVAFRAAIRELPRENWHK